MSYLFPGNIGGFSNGAVRSNQVVGRSVYGLGPMFDILGTVDTINDQTLFNLGGTGTIGRSVLPTIDNSNAFGTGTADTQADASYIAQTAYVSLVNGFGSSTTLLQLQNAYKSLWTTLGVTIIWILNKLTFCLPSDAMTQVQAFYKGTSDWSVYINGILPLIDTLFNAIQLRNRAAADAAVTDILNYLGGVGGPASVAVASLVGPTQLNCGSNATLFAQALFQAASGGTQSNLNLIAALASQNP